VCYTICVADTAEYMWIAGVDTLFLRFDWRNSYADGSLNLREKL
jgi:hypothetical protein